MNVPAKSRMLTTTCSIDSSGLPKLAVFISSRAEAASSPTTAGRSPLKTDSTVGCFWNFRKYLLIGRLNVVA